MKRQFKIIIVNAIFPILLSGKLFAQPDINSQPQRICHEFSVYSGGGLSGLNYNTTFGDQNLRLGGHLGLGYHYFFAPKWGIGTGMELALYNARFKMNDFDLSHPSFDIEERAPFVFHSTVSSYDEKQRTAMFQIPLMLYHQSKITESRRQYFGAVGVKAGIPLKGKYRSTASLSNAGEYEFENSLYDSQEFMGFGNFPNRKTKDAWDFKAAFFLSAEAGIKWNLRENRSLYTGIYFDYGLNNIMNSQSVSKMPTIVKHNIESPPAFTVNSVFHSRYTQERAFTNKITPIAVGIKVRLAFGKTCGQPQAQPQPWIPPVIADPCPDCDELRKALEDCETARKAAEDALEDCETARKAAEEDVRKVEEDAMDALKKLLELPIDHYVLNQTEPAEYQRRRLDEKIAVLKQYPHLRFYIQGHTCDIGTTSANERVGFGRDVGARAYLIANGIDESRILGVECKRDTMPVAPNTNETNRRMNRRVVIVLE